MSADKGMNRLNITENFPVRLKGKRKATLVLPVDLTAEDVYLIAKHLSFIAECSADHLAAPAETTKEPS